MGRLIVWNLVTLDGYFEGEEPWDLAFHNLAWGDELERLANEFGTRADTLVFGRKTYEGMKAYWTTAEPGEVANYMNALPKLVASRSLTSSDWNNTRITDDISGELAQRKASSEKDIYIFGSAELIDSILDANLIDEIMICLVPVLIGKGNRLFKSGVGGRLSLLETTPLKNGSVILRYAPAD